MEQKGRFVGALAGGTASLLLAAFVFVVFQQLRDAAVCAVLFAAVLLPLGFWVGYQLDKLTERAMKDTLTGSFNREWFAAWFPKLMHQANRRNKKITVSLIDINDFKHINDQYGHLAGDQVLQLISSSLRSNAAKGEIVVRWGGDEFLLICPYGNHRNVSALYASINETLEKLSMRLGMRVSASVGTSAFPEDGRTLEELLKKADDRMYGDKEDRKKPVVPEVYPLQA